MSVVGYLGTRDFDTFVADLDSISAKTRYTAASFLGDKGAEAEPAIPWLVTLLSDRALVIDAHKLAGETAAHKAEFSVPEFGSIAVKMSPVKPVL
jgi:hypothetical protein